MYNTYPNIIDALCNKTFKYKKGCVYFHDLYSRKLDRKHKNKVDQMYTMNPVFATCLQYDTIIPLQSQGLPNVYDALNAHTDQYRKGKVPLEMIYSDKPLEIFQNNVPTVIDAMNGHCNKYRRGKVQLSDIYKPDGQKHVIQPVYTALSEIHSQFNTQISLNGIA